MTTQWFIADLHFGHPKVSEIRGFSRTEPHDLSIVNQWMRQVHPTDEVWVLGDVVGRSSEEEYALSLLNSLPGTKHLIMGNHDSVSSIHRNGYKKQRRWMEVFESIQHFQKFRSNKRYWMASHYPYTGEGERDIPERYTQFRLPDMGLPLVHGHTHADHATMYSDTGREFCVSWDARLQLVPRSDIDKWVEELNSTGLRGSK